MSGPQMTAELRRSALGASEFGAVLGLDRFKDAPEVWMEKTGRAPVGDDETGRPTPIGDRAPMYWGLKLERQIGEAFAEVTEKEIRADNRTYRLEEHRVMAHKDFRVLHERAAVECKRPGLWRSPEWGAPGTDEIPETYLAQCHGQIWICDLELVYVPRLIGHDFQIFRVERDERWFPVFEERFALFWEYVERDELPPIDYSRRNAEATIKALHPKIDAELVLQWSDEELAITHALDVLAKESSELSKAVQTIRNRLRHRLGSAAWAMLPDGTAWRHRIQDRKGYEVKDTEVDEVRHVTNRGHIPAFVKEARQ